MRFAVQRTGDFAALQAILGHKTVIMTLQYSHLMTEHVSAIGTVPDTGAADLAR
jgi:hypothetical protein